MAAVDKRARIEATNPLNMQDSIYYQLLQSNLIQAYKLNLLNATNAFQPFPLAAPASTTIDAAASLLALSNGLVAPPGIIKPQAHKATAEPLKKLLLHQFEEQQRQLAASPVREQDCRESQTERPDSESTTSASESEDEPSLDALLAKHIVDPNTLRLIREKIADSQRTLELKIDSLYTQNHILQQEIACLRNKRSADASPVPSQVSSLKLVC
uniref:Uncharacterized protein n=1 Tax=Plectus sambesii TaxID=2011161 RepID=A0A914VKB6_9BILA